MSITLEATPVIVPSAIEVEPAEPTQIETPLFDVIAALQDAVDPGDDAAVIAAVARLTQTGRIRFRVYGEGGGAPQRNGQGLFARALIERFPLLPVEEEGRLHDMPLRENFIERVFAYYRWYNFVASNPSRKEVVRFHTQNKLTLLAHSRAHHQALGQLMARSGDLSVDALLREYGHQFMAGLKIKATRKKHANVLFHLQGHLKKHLDAADKAELVRCIEDYRQGFVPLVVPLTLLQHHFRRHPAPWVEKQTYLNPYPAELMLRNHV